MKSILERIEENISENGELSENFRINDKNSLMADGAKDGICIYHVGCGEASEKSKQRYIHGLKSASAGDFKEADEVFSDLGKDISVIKIYDEFVKYILDHRDELPVRKMYEYSIHVLLDSPDIECVKFGLCIISIIKIREEVKEIIRDLGLSDEFTIYVIKCMVNWDNSQMEILHLGQKVHSWGRVHAVEYLEPVNDEIRMWLLTSGIDSDLPDYSAGVCYRKADVPGLLKKEDWSYQEFHGVLKIINFQVSPSLFSRRDWWGNKDDETFLVLLEHAEKWIPIQEEDYSMLSNMLSCKMRNSGDWWDDEYDEDETDDEPDLEIIPEKEKEERRHMKEVNDRIKKLAGQLLFQKSDSAL